MGQVPNQRKHDNFVSGCPVHNTGCHGGRRGPLVAGAQESGEVLRFAEADMSSEGFTVLPIY